jgi:hypothetical protein
MKDSFTYEGYWWLPETPDNKVFGQFTFVPGDELSLKIQGTLDSGSTTKKFSHDFINPELIHGMIKDESGLEKNITIYKCHQTGGSLSGSGLQSSSFMGMAAFIGSHFDTIEQLEFRSLSVHFSNMEMWSSKSPLSIGGSDNKNERIVEYSAPSPVWAKTKDIWLQLVFHGPITSYSFTEATVSYQTRIEIAGSQKMKFERYLHVIRQLQNFFSLAMGAPTYPIAVIGRSDGNKILKEDESELFLPIDIYYLASSWPKEIKHIHSTQMLFTLPTIESNFEKCIQGWMEKYELLEPAINLYFSVLYNPSNFVEVKVLSLTQAIETYHRRLFDGKYQSDDTYSAGLYRDLINALPKELDPDFARSLSGRLKYGNEYSLRTRLRKIIERVTDILDFKFIASKQERFTFINKVVDTRNYWTHYSQELAKKAIQTNEERLILITQLQLLLEVSFLKDLDFDSTTVSKLIKRSYRYRLLKSRNV